MRGVDIGERSRRSVAFVAGGARGIGAEIARRLSGDGFAVAVADVLDVAGTVRSINAAGGAAVGYSCDIRDWDAVEATLEAIENDQGPIEAAISVAGVYRDVPFLELDPAQWRAILETNLDGTFHVCRLSAERMATRRRGAIVCISSNAAFLAWSGGTHYSASKAGIIGLVKGMALELGPLGIRANAICPGTINSYGSESALADPVVAANQARACPLERVGTSADIAEAVAFLVDPVRAAWITGEAMLVDGGFGTHGERAYDFAGSDTTV